MSATCYQVIIRYFDYYHFDIPVILIKQQNYQFPIVNYKIIYLFICK